MLHVKNLSKTIGNKEILKNVDLKVKRGEIAVLLGASGVGKSTLLKILNNLETMTAGSVELDDTRLDLATANRNHTIGMVFQHFNLFDHLSVLENITLALVHVADRSQSEADTAGMDLLRKYNLADKSNARISQLSGGQKQRLAIARTLALQPTIICFDEPTSALDPLLTAYVAKNIAELASQGYIVIVTTHDVGLIERLPSVIHLMEHGTIVESISSVELSDAPHKYPRMASFIQGNVL